MVWENKMHTIVMVTRCEEAGKVVLELKSTTFTLADSWYISRSQQCINACMCMHIIICRPSVSSTGPRSCMTASLQETSSV